MNIQVKFSKEKLLKYLSWLMFIILTLPIYFSYKQGLYADSMYFESLVRDLFQDNGMWDSWRMQPSASYFPDMIVYIIAYYLSPYAIDHLFLVGFIQAMLLAFFSILLYRVAYEKNNLLVEILIVMFWTVASYCAYKTNMPLYFHSTNAVIGTVINSLICYYLVTQSIAANKKLYGILLALLIVLSVISSQLFMLTFIIPLLLTLFFFLVIESGSKTVKLKLIVILLASLIVGYLFARCITYNDPMISKATVQKLIGSNSIIDVLNSLTMWEYILMNLKIIFLSDNLWFNLLSYTGLIGLILVIYNGVRIYFKYSSANTDFTLEEMFFVFLFFLIPVNVFGIILSGGFMHPWAARYFMFPMILCIIVGLEMYGNIMNRFSYKFSYYVLLFTITMTIIFGVTHFDELKPRKLTVEEARTHVGTMEKDVVDCLDQNKEKFNLKVGISSYLLARPVRLFSKKGIIVNFFEGERRGPGLNNPGFWMNSRDWYLGGKTQGSPKYNFIAISDSFLTPYYSISSMRRIYGKETSSFECSAVPMTVLVYDESTNFNDKVMDESIIYFSSQKFLQYIP